MSEGISIKSIPYSKESKTGCIWATIPSCRYASPAHMK